MLFQSSPVRLIPLTQGLWTLVDEVDYGTLSEFKWWAERQPTGVFYAVRSSAALHHVPLRMHRVILDLPQSRVPYVDHRNRDSLDNRRSNLRIATAAQNGANVGLTRNNTTGYVGVYRIHAERWRAHIIVNRKRIHLGYFPTAEGAARVRDAAAVRLQGEFAYLNFPDIH